MRATAATVFMAGCWLATANEFCPAEETGAVRSGITLENEYVVYRITGDGKNLSFVDRSTGTDYCRQPGQRPFITLSKEGVQYQPTSCTMANGEIFAHFQDVDAVVVIKTTVKNRYFVFEVESVSDPLVDELRLANLAVTSSKYVSGMSGIAADGNFSVCLRALNPQLRVQVNGPPAVVACTCYRKYGLAGAKFALVGCPSRPLRGVLKEVVRNEGLPYSPLGGPWALDAEENRGSYTFAYVSEANVDQWIQLAKKAALTHVHLNGWASSLGHYEPREAAFPQGLAGLKTVVDKLHAAGLKAGMHTLTGCISTADRWVTPVPDRRLAADASYRLAFPLDQSETTVLIKEQPGEFDTVWGYGSSGNVVRVDEELIQFSGLSRKPPYGFTNCKRGAFGTRASPHKKGADVDHLLVRWGYFHPDENSTLMDDIAAAIARVFNTCGFDMIYMDGVTEEISGGWHGAAKMRRAIYDKLNRPALVEASCWDYHSWPFHSRLGAWDHPKHGLKSFIDVHCRLSELDIDGRTTERYRQSTLLPTQLGWWAIFGPTRDHRGELPDEIEYLCCKALGLDSALSFQNIQVGGRSENARQDEYLAMIGRYERLRLADYFPEPVKARLKQPGEEFRLAESPDGDWRFVPTDYALHKVTGLEDGSGTWKVNNRFAGQPIKLRIEALYSVEPYDSDDSLVLTEFAEDDEFSDRASAPGVSCELSASDAQVKVGPISGRYAATNKTGARRGAWSRCSKDFGPEIDLDDYGALGLWIRGDGKGELLNVQLTNSPQHNLAYDEHYVKVDFKGWRYFELLMRERDADKYDQYVWPYGGHSAVYRRRLVRDHVDRLNLYFNDLPPGESVTCYLSPIRALRTSKATLRNPAIEIDGRRIIFPAAMESGAYLEFESESDCRLYDERGALIGSLQPQGETPLLAAGENEVRFTCQGPKQYNVRACVTVVSQGEPFGGKR